MIEKDNKEISNEDNMTVYELICIGIGADIAVSADNRFCRYGKSLSESVIGIGRYRVQYWWPYRYILNPAPE